MKLQPDCHYALITDLMTDRTIDNYIIACVQFSAKLSERKLDCLAGLSLFIWLTDLFRVMLGSSSSSNTSWEHHIRSHLLDNYDRKVRPVHKGRGAVEVSFAMRVSRLVKVVRSSILCTFFLHFCPLKRSVSFSYQFYHFIF